VVFALEVPEAGSTKSEQSDQQRTRTSWSVWLKYTWIQDKILKGTS